MVGMKSPAIHYIHAALQLQSVNSNLSLAQLCYVRQRNNVFLMFVCVKHVRIFLKLYAIIYKNLYVIKLKLFYIVKLIDKSR